MAMRGTIDYNIDYKDILLYVYLECTNHVTFSVTKIKYIIIQLSGMAPICATETNTQLYF